LRDIAYLFTTLDAIVIDGALSLWIRKITGHRLPVACV